MLIAEVITKHGSGPSGAFPETATVPGDGADGMTAEG